MLITKPSYFDSFRCIASACPDSCCKEWDVQVDGVSAEFYRNLPGSLGDRLREVLYEEDGETYMAINPDRRCPMWRDDGLCRIQAEQGEEAMCKTSREFPRLTHNYGDFIERGLELSCPEAARIILSAPVLPWVMEEVPGGQEPEYDLDAMAVLKATRQEMLALLQWDRPVGEVLVLALLYGYQAQSLLDGGEEIPFDPEAALAEARSLAKPGEIAQVLELFSSLEILTPQWEARLQNPAPAPFTDVFRLLARYFVERYWLQAVSDYDLYCRVKFILVSCLVIASLGGSLVETAQLYSKEIENSASNLDALLDAAYAHPALTDDKLLGLLLSWV